jgi:large exoprotein involved in heme utilization and adhesion
VIEATRLVRLDRGGSEYFTGVNSSFNSDAVGNGGGVQIITDSLEMVNGAQVSASTFGEGDAGNVVIEATGLVRLDGEDSDYFTGISSSVDSDAVGNGGGVEIKTDSLEVVNGAAIGATTFGKGDAGNVVIEATGLVKFDRGGSEDVTGAGSRVEPGAVGNAGGVQIRADSLEVLNGAAVSASTFGEGDAGTVVIEATGLVRLDRGGSESFTGVASNVNSGAVGNGGGVEIKADSLEVVNGAEVGANTFGEGDGGNVVIEATRLVRLDGGGSEYVTGVASSSEGTGNAGGIEIISPHLFIDNGGQVSVSNLGEGEGGDLEITSDIITLSHGIISAETSGNQGGNVTLAVTDTLFLERNSEITATAGTETGIGDGGNITIDTGFLIAIPQENNDIVANAFLGRGGTIQIKALSVLGITPRPELTPLSDINASSESGINGTVSITTPDTDPNDAIIELSDQVIDIEWLSAQNPCSVDNDTIARGSSFIITGRGGIHPGSQDAIPSLQRIVPWQSLETPKSPVTVESRTTDSIPTPQLINGWIITSDGTIYLTQNATKSSYQPPCLPLEN